MNRCPYPLPRRLLALGALLTGLAAPVGAQAPQRIPPIPAAARPGVLEVTLPPEVRLDEESARLSPGARIRDRNNLLVVSAPLVGRKLPVRYVRDSLGLIHEVWILTEAEVLAAQAQQTSGNRP